MRGNLCKDYGRSALLFRVELEVIWPRLPFVWWQPLQLLLWCFLTMTRADLTLGLALLRVEGCTETSSYASLHKLDFSHIKHTVLHLGNEHSHPTTHVQD